MSKTVTLAAFFPTTTETKSWFDGGSMPWETQDSPAEPQTETPAEAPMEPDFVKVASGTKISVRREVLSYEDVCNIVSSKIFELKQALNKADSLVNNQVGSQNQRKKSLSQQAGSISALKKAVTYWRNIQKALETSNDYLEVYYKWVRRGNSPEVIRILADLKRA